MNKIKKGDKVQVMRGKDAGKSGLVLRVVETTNRRGVAVTKVVVEGAAKVKKHQKPNPTLNTPGGILEFESPMAISNVMVLDPKTGKPTRVGFKVDPKTGVKTRIAKKSGTVLK